MQHVTWQLLTASAGKQQLVPPVVPSERKLLRLMSCFPLMIKWTSGPSFYSSTEGPCRWSVSRAKTTFNHFLNYSRQTSILFCCCFYSLMLYYNLFLRRNRIWWLADRLKYLPRTCAAHCVTQRSLIGDNRRKNRVQEAKCYVFWQDAKYAVFRVIGKRLILSVQADTAPSLQLCK